MVNGADAVARLDNWFWTPVPPGRDALIGEIFDDPPPRSWPDGADCKTSNVSELEQQGAVEGKIIVTMTGRRYLLGKAATHASLAAERDDAQREADALREQLEALQAAQPAVVAAGLTQKKRPRGRAPAGYCWDKQKCGWVDENGKPFELVDHPSRRRLAAVKRTAVLESCTVVWKASLLLEQEEQRREPRQAVLQERQAHLAQLRQKRHEQNEQGLVCVCVVCVCVCVSCVSCVSCVCVCV